MTTPEPVTGATQDPRWTLITEIVSPLLWSPHTDRTALAKEITDAIDAADATATAGIRRVPDINTVNSCGDLMDLMLRTLADYLTQGGDALPGRKGSARHQRSFDAGVKAAVDTLHQVAAANRPAVHRG